MQRFALSICLYLFLMASLNAQQTAEEYYQMADEKEEAGDLQYALVLIEKAAALDSTDMWIRLKMSSILLAQDRFFDGLDQLYLAKKLAPDRPEPLIHLGNLSMETNDLEGAVRFFDQAERLDTTEVGRYMIYVNRATAYGVLRNFEKGIADLEEAYRIDSSDLVVLNNLSAFYQEVGQVNEGIRILKRLVELQPDFEGSYVNLGLVYAEMDSFETSTYYFAKAFELMPDDPLLLNNMGYLEYRKGNYSKALELIGQSVNLLPYNPYAYRNRALVYIALEQFEEVCRELDIAEYYQFAARYGDEVAKLKEKYCKKE